MLSTSMPTTSPLQESSVQAVKGSSYPKRSVNKQGGLQCAFGRAVELLVQHSVTAVGLASATCASAKTDL